MYAEIARVNRLFRVLEMCLGKLTGKHFKRMTERKRNVRKGRGKEENK
jgi:hypothetical protein